MDVFEDPVTNTVTAALEIPGVSRDTISIDVFDNRLTVSGEVASFFGENYGYILRERRTGPFVRTLALPTNIPVSHKSACLRHYMRLINYIPNFDHRWNPSKPPWNAVS